MDYPGTDAALVTAARDGDQAAMDRLVDESLGYVLRWTARLAGGQVDPEDAAHDVIMVLITRLHTLREPEQFPYWLFGTTRHVISGHRRASWLKRWVPGRDPEAVADEDPRTGYTPSDCADVVDLVLGHLSARQREVLVLCDIEERSATEAGVVLGVPPGTVKSRLRVAREKFRKIARRLRVEDQLVEAATGRLS
jgi:RNA polymerase sigma-70 factor (ECF subfamily)